MIKIFIRFYFFLAFIFCLSTHLFAQPTAAENDSIKRIEKKLWQQYHTSKDSTQSVLILIQLAENKMQFNKERAEQLAKKAVALSEITSSKAAHTKAILCLTNIYYDMGKYDEAYTFANELLDINETETDAATYARACKAIGKNFHYQGNYAKALSYYLRGLNYFETTNELQQCGEFYNAIGGVYFKQTDFDKAADCYRKSLNIQKKIKSNYGIGRGYLNMGCVYIEQKKLNMGHSTLDSTMYFFKKENSKQGMAFAFSSFGDLYLAENKPDSALANLLIAYRLMKEVNKVYALAELNLTVTELYLKQHQPQSALKYIDEGIEIGLANKQNDNLSKFYLYKSKAFETMNNTGLALANYKLYKAFSDSVLNEKSIKKQMQASMQYDFSKREIQLEEEKQKQLNAQHEKEMKFRRILFFVLLLIAVAAMFLGFWFVIKQRASRKISMAYNKLEQKNKIIESSTTALQASLAERNLLLKEIHHRVKNNLQVISSLFDLQSAQLTDEYAKQVLQESQGRIGSIALLHHQLYQQEDVTGVQLNKFVTDLYLQVAAVYHKNNVAIKFENQLPDLFLDLDTAIPIGLILNELLTNSFKYAFTLIDTPTILLSFENTAENIFCISYKDNGVGLPTGFDWKKSKTLGIRIINQLSKQLKGKMEYRFENGSCFEIYFKK